MTADHDRDLVKTAHELVAPGKGILAADESTSTMSTRLKAVGAVSTPDSRRDFRELLFTAAVTPECISGVILYDETLRQRASDGTPIPELLAARGLAPGIKVDTGAKPLAGSPGEKVTEGLDGLRERLAEYRELGARFAKWRAVIELDERRPTRACLNVNAHALARYAALCQEAGVVPIVEPEVLMDGGHSIDRAQDATSATLRTVFAALEDQNVALEGMLLKPNMVLAGYDCPDQADVETVAQRTLRCLRRAVPAAVPGIVFLSGGQSDERATAHLNAMNKIGGQPWELSFSYGRALQATPLAAWAGESDNARRAQELFAHRVRCTGAARQGRYSAALELEPVA